MIGRIFAYAGLVFWAIFIVAANFHHIDAMSVPALKLAVTFMTTIALSALLILLWTKFVLWLR